MKKIGIQIKDNEGSEIYPNPFPIGAIYFSTDSRNPSQIFGGTWERFAKGRVIVGIDENQTEFNQVNKIGGSKYLQKHNHGIKDAPLYWREMVDGGQVIAEKTTTAESVIHYTDNSGTGESGNLQPYIAVYIWRRVS